MWTALLGDLLQVFLLPDLGTEARALAAAQVTTLASLSASTPSCGPRAGPQLGGELADRGRPPAFLQPLGNGQVAAAPNPMHPATPHAFDAPGARRERAQPRGP
jgi:hypothetical protein